MHDLNDLAAFDSVMRTASLTASARELGLPKSTLSRRIKRVEAQVGQLLLRREANRMLPTQAGVLFHGYCVQVLALSAECREALAELKEDISGELTLHVHEAFARGWLPQKIEAFMARHGGVRIVLRTLADLPLTPAHDLLCLWLGVVPPCGLRQERLGRLTRGLYAHPDYLAKHGEPRHPHDLMQHAWVDLLDDRQPPLRLQHPSEDPFEVELPPSRMRVDQLVLHADAIARGLGIGMLPHWIAQLRERHHPGTLRPCLPAWQAPSLPIHLLYPHGHLPRRCSAFIEHLRRAVPAAWRPGAPPSPADTAAPTTATVCN